MSLMQGIANIQKKVTKLAMDGFNPYYSSKFTTLGVVIDNLKPAAQEEGILIMQPSVGGDGEAGVETVITDIETGESISYRITIPITGSNIGQEAGKIITYLRRYALASIFMLYSDEDIDANNPDQQETKGKKETPKKKKKDEPDLEALISDYWAPLTAVADELGIKYDPLPDDITQGRFGELFLALQEKVENAQEEE